MQHGAPITPPIWLAATAGLLLVWLSILPAEVADDAPTATKKLAIDATTLHRKVLCGYQGWFRCPGDPADAGWKHWSHNPRRIAPETLTVEMWPDLTEYTDEEKYRAPGFTSADGKAAYLFSSAQPRTVARHFQWMEEYGIDGVFLQRFLVSLADPSTDRVLAHVRASAVKTGRVYALCYDLTGFPKERIYDLLTRDWQRLVDKEKVTKDRCYLHHAGKPVVFVWGFYSDQFGPELAHRIIDYFKADNKYAATLIGGCPWYWRNEKDKQWAKAFRRLDVISPWNVGNVMKENNETHAATGSWPGDLAECKRAGMGFLPVIYPGFGWTNLKGKEAARDTIPRLGGKFYWRQFATAADLGVEMAYVAMFDEVDEATAIFKVSNSPPAQARFLTYDGLPADWYLRLTGEGSKVIRRELKSQATLPIKP
ncbi:MAG: glycoside hydrolase family 71/99-like protein [Gemmataceae bacterium]